MQRTIKILTILAAMIITAGQTWADEPSLLTGNGEGTSDNPYQISSYAALKEFASLVNGTDRYAESANHSAYAILTTDIVCKNDPNDEGYATDWVPIGNDTHPYTGTFDGKGHSITGLSNTGIAEVANSDYQGLFGYVGSGGVVKKVTLEYASITGKESVGGIVGYNQGTVSDCHVGSGVTIRIVQSNSSRIGGIVGSSYNGTVIDCTSAASFTMAANLGQCGEFGGIVGLASNSTVSNCLYLGDQIGGNYGVGAIVGNNYKTGDTDAIVSNCFFTSTTFTGKDNETLSNANSAVGSNNWGTVTNCGLAYAVTLGNGVTFSSTENTNTVGVKYDGKFYAPENAQVALTYTGTAPEGKTFYAISVKAADNSSANVTESNSDYMFYMPAKNVTATAVFKAYLTGVSYVDPTAEEPNKQTAEGTKVWVLDGTEAELIAGWYVCNIENLNYTSTIKLIGDVNLILADGKTMNIGTSESRISGHGIEYSNYDNGQSLTIYGQSGGTGALNVYVTSNRTAIAARNVTINGGQVTATDAACDIFAIDNVIINGGQVTATGSVNGIGINAYTGDIVLGWTNTTDFIEASSFKCENSNTSGKVVKTADGKVLQFTDGDNTMKLIGDITDLDAIKNQKLTPYGIGGYCGTDDTKTTDVDECKTLTWDIALKDEPTSATDLATTLTIEGCGTMASYTTEAPAPWSDKTIEAANILASADVANVNAIAENIPVTLGYTGPVATTHTFNGYFVRKTADNTNISANVLSHNDQTDAWTLTMPDYAVNVSPKLTRNTTVSVEVANANGITAGYDANVTVTVDPVTAEGDTDVDDVSGIATISVTKDSKTTDYNVAVVDGTGKFNVTNMENESFTINAAFAANDQWSASQTTAPVELYVPMVATSLGISLDKSSIYVGETATVSITLDKSMNAVVTARRVNHGEEFTDDTNLRNGSVALVNGKGTLELSGFDAGIYDIRVEYAGNDEIKGCTSSVLTLTVSKRETGVSVSTNSPVIAKEQVYD
jgi:hypothetical protein